ncbi:hypothetical protein [Flavobacterium pectinovorum]|uniref:hypothetical protein n=1 Tax=Flavobacterium pectinovorum TaxID=29533 RepID=UPI001FADE741|nr:hypothetical protein [Flavobacterium pectinovorum]MCI9843312.1 hypothetical protein [Flavobacterium pectinovorum]
MEIENYFIGKNKKEIFITVTVSTHGIAVTEVKLIINGSIFNKGASTNGAGLISRTSLGFASQLDGGTIKIETDIVLTKIPKSAWGSCFENLQIHYYLEGGEPDQKNPFELLSAEKKKSSSGETIIATKRINLVNR